MRLIFIIITGLLLTLMLSCASLQDVITPCYIDNEAADYAEEEISSFLPYTSLWDARRIKKHMNQSHLLNQTELKRLTEDDILTFDFLNDNLSLNISDALEFQNNVFSPSSPIGLLAPASMGLVLGWLGLTKPGDLKRNEVEEV